ncbi:VOC family protein [Staphylococcus chromogenes]|uniref:VOC family protein n=1 Tax=Staphylococcus chromogenes TaxID=46126 RepID=UPI001F188D3C|nr:glyoxalase/bleomycin resistance/extradiol dioxygenase family protein [Staphylococcus chromogenes]MCE5042695.1 glyoxalase/bleomycin resistance/extradiol dioxygenase family protein [Staphylococcus chromogenes]MDT0656359.1 glyoxalase/bleomycin resistance/extradiol dioxygenase family protein [Staphylococcus chromogenes]MDT0671259.1 glyoxalase/bleomycin resistance/extradiol dioxygenase family protein [Staphylococcus chromogenes]MDT0673451.1 glyoxalase/bleomycin resistance/extradiol dioxygenase fa
MTTLYPYLSFENTKEALAYYEEVFGATDILRLPVSEKQAQQFGVDPSQAENATMHSEFSIANVQLFASDSFGGSDKINGAISLMLNYDINNKDDEKEIQALYDRVKEHPSVTVEMPFEDQFWGGKMGVLKDQYGVRWMLHGEDGTKRQ